MTRLQVNASSKGGIRDDTLLRPAEVAELLDVSERQLKGWRNEGLLVFTYLGGSRKEARILGGDLKHFLASCRGEQALTKAQQRRRSKTQRMRG